MSVYFVHSAFSCKTLPSLTLICYPANMLKSDLIKSTMSLYGRKQNTLLLGWVDIQPRGKKAALVLHPLLMACYMTWSFTQGCHREKCSVPVCVCVCGGGHTLLYKESKVWVNATAEQKICSSFKHADISPCKIRKTHFISIIYKWIKLRSMGIYSKVRSKVWRCMSTGNVRGILFTAGFTHTQQAEYLPGGKTTSRGRREHVLWWRGLIT